MLCKILLPFKNQHGLKIVLTRIIRARTYTVYFEMSVFIIFFMCCYFVKLYFSD